MRVSSQNGKSSRLCAWAMGALVASFVILFFGGNARAADEGQDLFKSKCVMCHGPDGSGNTPMGKRLSIPDLRSPEVQKLTDDQLADVIKNGKGKMTPVGKSMTPEQVKQLVQSVRQFGKK